MFPLIIWLTRAVFQWRHPWGVLFNRYESSIMLFPTKLLNIWQKPCLQAAQRLWLQLLLQLWCRLLRTWLVGRSRRDSILSAFSLLKNCGLLWITHDGWKQLWRGALWNVEKATRLLLCRFHMSHIQSLTFVGMIGTISGPWLEHSLLRLHIYTIGPLWNFFQSMAITFLVLPQQTVVLVLEGFCKILIYWSELFQPSCFLITSIGFAVIGMVLIGSAFPARWFRQLRVLRQVRKPLLLRFLVLYSDWWVQRNWISQSGAMVKWFVHLSWCRPRFGRKNCSHQRRQFAHSFSQSGWWVLYIMNYW